MISGDIPVKWFVLDNWCEPQPDWTVPQEINPLWIRYESDCEHKKRTTIDTNGWWGQTLELLNSNATVGFCEQFFNCPLETDPTMHGGGLHVMANEGFLGCHLDYDRHPKLPTKRRAVNLLAFCHNKWERGWGGELYLADPLGNVVVEIQPLPGRLVGFETNDLSYHGVNKLVEDFERISVASYLLTEATQRNTRQRALFIPNREVAKPSTPHKR